MSTGTELQEARERAGLTQEQVAAKLGVHRQTVTAWEGKAQVKPLRAERFLTAVRELGEKAAA